MAEVEGNEPEEQAKEQGAQVPAEQPEGEKPSGRTFTDEEVDAIIDRRFAKWQRKQEQKVAEAAKLAEMNAQEKAEYQRDEMSKRLAEYERRDAVRQMTDESRRQLRDAGVDVPDEVVAMLVGEDAETTKQAVDRFAAAFTGCVEAEVRRRLAGGTPRAGAEAKPMTADEIMKVKDPLKRQGLIREHIKEFRK